jgi:hypothetical protein
MHWYSKAVQPTVLLHAAAQADKVMLITSVATPCPPVLFRQHPVHPVVGSVNPITFPLLTALSSPLVIVLKQVPPQFGGVENVGGTAVGGSDIGDAVDDVGETTVQPHSGQAAVAG